MNNTELAKKLYWMARHGLAANWQDNVAIKEAADKLTALGRWALVCEEAPRVLTWEEILAAPDGAVLWEEFHDSGAPLTPMEETPAPVVKIGRLLHGSGTDTDITADMGEMTPNAAPATGCYGWRWWCVRPSAQLCAETPWPEAPAPCADALGRILPGVAVLVPEEEEHGEVH